LAVIRLLILEPDQWRYRGFCGFLKDSVEVEILGEPDFAKILTLKSSPEGLNPELIFLAFRLILDHGIALVPHLRDLFPSCAVLVQGDSESLDVTAQLFAVGASGYYLLTEPPDYLPIALSVVSRGQLWGPREALALMGYRTPSKLVPGRIESGSLPERELTILRLLHEGLSNKEIAQRLGLAQVTIKSKLTRLYKRFGVSTRLQLLSSAIDKGLVGPRGA